MSILTIIVLGASYAGHRAAQVLAQNLPPPCRIVVIERNTHANHLYSFPRFAVVPGHEHKAFIPYTNIFKTTPIISPDAPKVADPSKHLLIHGHVTHVSDHSVRFIRLQSDSQSDHSSTSSDTDQHEELAFDYLVYALGSHLPAPINIWSETPNNPPPRLSIESTVASPLTTPTSTAPISFNNVTTRALGGLETPSTPTGLSEKSYHPFGSGAKNLDFDKLSISEDGNNIMRIKPTSHQQGTKAEGRQWLQAAQERVRVAQSVLVIGGGALGVQFASDIAGHYPDKKVTLVHSGAQLLPRFDKWLHDEALKILTDLGVDVVLSSRVDLSSKTKRTLRTCDGRLIAAELILLCTGQKPNTSLLSSIAPHSINPQTGMVSVLRSMQIGYYERPPRPTHSTFQCAKGLSQGECACRETFDFGVSEAHDLEWEQTKHDQSPHPHIFVVGDAADAFGALNAGHTAYAQAEIAARNICKLISSGGTARLAPVDPPAVTLKRSRRLSGVSTPGIWHVDDAVTLTEKKKKMKEEETLESYSPPFPSIKVSVGLDKAIYQTGGKFGARGPEDCPLDNGAPNMWKRRGLSAENMFL